ncbi:hypothetical protein PVIIG_05253 [Plasmodium vivax India VII]|uniref:Uncharacterized protein n=1 Tax=Plasmodium vivax India VII TaxID=1077284 RepID=A0A0J9VA63_PLAVI|nr:hypothetical protein PVIIG_05253 [Plasmodium vivax India VII]
MEIYLNEIYHIYHKIYCNNLQKMAYILYIPTEIYILLKILCILDFHNNTPNIESYVESSSLHELISTLNDTKYENCHELNLDIFKSVDAAHKVTLKNIGCNLEWGYRFLSAFNGKPLTDLCEYLNLWLDEQKRTHVNGKSGITEEEWQTVETLWNNVQTYYIIPKCARKDNGHNISHIQDRMKLMTYCIYRDYIKRLCEPSMRSGFNISDVCFAFYEFMKEHYATFYKEDHCIDYSDEPTKFSYNISDECTLYNMTKTFPVFDSNLQTILEKDNLRPTRKKCGIPPKEEHGRNEQTEDGTDALRESSESDNSFPESQVGLTELEVRHSGHEVDHVVPPVLNPPASTDASLTDNGPSKPIYYVGLSALGVLFTSMILYKVKKL